ncbi:hypothetical protein QFC22_005776 [Naganishia vaughanmartiniae]|uniref:Uncharacterized protein n=1 Tax=Naganishia vaughanmartiniae TaxID=1424756 RepID=A0ACC2WRE2_9TREE|nr:hypothetical protein QFC22_005776 [Naganishia vaughanmartiniae]
MAFSRVALAAALLEYDNDNPASGLAPRKARESAIILGAVAPPPLPPSQASVVRDGIQQQRGPQHRFSGIIEDRGSTYGYIPGKAPPWDGPEEADMADMGMQEDMDVDLTEWGIPETSDPYPRHRDQLRINTSRESLRHDPSSPLNRLASPTASHGQPAKPAVTSPTNRRNRKGRTVSFHDYTSIYNQSANQQGEDGMEELAHAPQQGTRDGDGEGEGTVRPRSSMSIMNRGRPTSPFNAPQASPTAATGSVAVSPTGSSVLPMALHIPLPGSPGQATPTSPPSRSMYNQSDDQLSNPFALPPPAGPRLSRFDPKVIIPTVGEQPTAAGGPSSRGNGERPTSLASGYFPRMNSHRTSLVAPPQQQQHHQQPTTISRLRPRTLMMPTPLHGTLDPSQSAPDSRWDTEGYHKGAKPMPPGALTRPDSFVGLLNDKAGVASGRNRFSSTQQLFRVTLASVDAAGKQGSQHTSAAGYGYETGFMDIPPSAERDGEVGVQQYGGRGDDDDDGGDEDFVEPGGEQDWRPETRFVQGPSLMDRLEARKAELKSKQRVFRGDNRPAMMSRSSNGPLVTLDPTVDPLTGQTSPRLQNHASLVLQDDDGRLLARSASQGEAAGRRPNVPPTRGKSVFGVDTLWEKEVKKLEAQRKVERGLALQIEEEQGRKKKGGRKGKRRQGPSHPELELEQEGTRVEDPYTETMHSQGRQDVDIPPSLSLGDLANALEAPFNPSQGRISDVANPSLIPHTNVDVDDWAAGSDDEAGLAAQPRRRKRRTVKPVVPEVAGSDSEDDNVPLAKAFGVTRAKSRAEESDSSEDEPLSNLKKKVSSRTLDVADEDDVPLALRRAKKSTVGAAQHTASPAVDEDDMPLAQRRLRAQGTGMADPHLQQQQHHLAMAMQHQSMMMNPMMSMYGHPPVMNMGIMGMPSPMGMMPGAPPFGAFNNNNVSAYSLPHAAAATPPDPKIDRWRREIEAREGSMVSVPPSVVTSGGRT